MFSRLVSTCTWDAPRRPRGQVRLFTLAALYRVLHALSRGPETESCHMTGNSNVNVQVHVYRCPVDTL